MVELVVVVLVCLAPFLEPGRLLGEEPFERAPAERAVVLVVLLLLELSIGS